MKVLLLLAIPLLLQDAEKTFRRPLNLRNGNDEILPAGVQVGVPRPGGMKGSVELRYKGRPVPCWPQGELIWFRVAEAIGPLETSQDYELLNGKVASPPAPHDVFEFFEEPGEKAPDPKRWSIDPFLKFEADPMGWAVTHLPEGRTELDPASLIARHGPLPDDFIIEADIQWMIAEKASFTFAAHLEIDEAGKVDEKVRQQCADLIAKLAEDDIEVQEVASNELYKIGPAAVPQLVAACRSSNAQVRARAKTVIRAIHKESPPQLARVGFRVEPGQKPKLLFNQGRGDVEFTHLERIGKASVSIERFKNGLTSVRCHDQKWKKIPTRIPGTVGRLRFDFSGEPAGYIGAVWISRVIIRRSVELEPTAVWGKAEEVR